jgi:hypothetical protein
MNFKKWFILSEELYTQNNTATVFHRTKSFDFVQQMMNGGFTAGGGDYHGPGLYTTYTLEGTTNLGYGPYVVKLKVKNLKNYFVLEPDVAQQIHGDNWKLKDQARILELTLKLTDEQWEKYQKISESGKFGSAAASQALKSDGHKLWEHGCKGIVYNGEQDGKCICVYAPYEGLQFLAYAHAETPTTVDFIEKNWVKSSKDVSIRSISDLKFPKDTGIGSTSIEKQYEIENPENKIRQEIDNAISSKNYAKILHFAKKPDLSKNEVISLLKYNVDSDEDVHHKEIIFKSLGSDNINKIDGVFGLFEYSGSMSDELFDLIIKYKTKLTPNDVRDLLYKSKDVENAVVKLGKENIDKLSGDGVQAVISKNIYNDINFEKLSKILNYEMINKLEKSDIYNLLSYSSDGILKKLKKLLGKDIINKLNSDNVYFLIRNRNHDVPELVKTLGSTNINKLDANNCELLISNAEDKYFMKQLLKMYYTGTDEEVISLLDQ